jgi:hypothetical protein
MEEEMASPRVGFDHTCSMNREDHQRDLKSHAVGEAQEHTDVILKAS